MQVFFETGLILVLFSFSEVSLKYDCELVLASQDKDLWT
jgi:hypothetical protein